jgi:GMP synthase (glutamine-hydrolysing)
VNGKPLVVVFTGTTLPNVKERHGDFDRHFRDVIGEAWSGPWASVDARDTTAPLPSFRSAAGFLVTGSSSSVTEREQEAWMPRLEAWLRDAVAAEVPLLGVCFGHQILASALGGEVRKNPAGRRIGRLEVARSDTDDPLLDGVPARFHVNVSHRDHVAVAPRGIRPLIVADHDPIHAFAHGPKARAVQFHPEFHEGVIRGYIEARREILRGEGLDPDLLEREIGEVPHAQRILRNFVTRFVAER